MLYHDAFVSTARTIAHHATSLLTRTYRPGDQHRDTPATTNPFADNKPKVSEYTAQELATLQSRLDKQLGPEYISTRPGAGGGKVHYLAAEKVINLANEVFGFNGWSSSIQNVQIDFVDENPNTQKITLGLSTIVRVTLRDGTFHEDIGYGHIENCKGKAAAFEKAKKEAATDALKRALRNFGNVLGNCLYDKDYLQRVTKVKVAPSKWDADNLHRHPDYAPVKKEAISEAESKAVVAVKRQSSVQSANSFGSAEFEDDFGGSLLNEEDFTHPDEVHIDDSTVTNLDSPAKRAVNGQQRAGVSRTHTMPQTRPPNVHAPASILGPQAPQRPPAVARPPSNAAQMQAGRMAPPQQNGALQRMPQQQNGHSQQRPQYQTPQYDQNTRSNPSSGTTVADSPSNQLQPNGQTVSNVDGQDMDDNGLPAPRLPPPGLPEGFVTGRSVDLLNQPVDQRPPASSIAFNPHAESPSIRRTHGINPGKSAPVSRTAIAGSGANAASSIHGTNGVTTPVRTNFVNPSADTHRRLGAPLVAGGMQNRGAYKPPTAVGTKRTALSDVTSNTNMQGAQLDGAGDAKKPKMEGVKGEQQPDAGREHQNGGAMAS
ncbi:Rad52/22 family double-strand break repair protein [Teratosphaeria destructans]|uniref:RAD52 homolog n=1 Tax=Teratosphaeria destructans TaxID=418781 RepID=A0A9W7SY14_9PEZI|nr:Rad52/22 family double-strand break repair protein [Teratosphaeria destructans]